MTTHRAMAAAGALLLITVLTAITACKEVPSWQTLLAAKIAQQYPQYSSQATADGQLLVQRPGMTSVPVDVKAIAAFCLRGNKDCDYAMDQMLLQLQQP